MKYNIKEGNSMSPIIQNLITYAVRTITFLINLIKKFLNISSGDVTEA